MKRTSLILASIVASAVFTLFLPNASGQTSQGWTTYYGGTSYSIDVPQTVELRNANDSYSQALKRLNLDYNEGSRYSGG